MRFLIDECLHASLAHLAIQRGHDAWHVNWLGLSGTADWNLMPRIVSDDFTFVTNNAEDFRRLYAQTQLHAGVVILLSQVSPPQQRELLEFLWMVRRSNTISSTRPSSFSLTRVYRAW